MMANDPREVVLLGVAPWLIDAQKLKMSSGYV